MDYTVKEEIPGVWFVDLKVGGEEEYTGAYIVASGNETALVEVGPRSTAEKLLKAFHEIGLNPESVKYILLTHIHLDHAGASGAILEHFPNAYVVAHKKGIPHLVDPEEALWKASNKVLGFVAEMYGKPEPVPEQRTIPVEKKTTLALGKFKFTILPTPGHASHHVCIFLQPRDVIFTGDAAGIYIPSLDVILPATPPPFRLSPALKSIRKLIALKPKLIAYTHFNISPNAVPNLQKHYDQLKVWHESTKEIVAKGIENEEETLELIAERDNDLKKFLIASEKLGGLRRGVKTGLQGFLQLTI
ncbi:MAG TPA: MBL fold metallo-hydrolase [Thermodesulfobacteriota bacterium]|nr:MBL fold metallo-hydrolase [Thermodesulfobacteriota bacterium]